MTPQFSPHIGLPGSYLWANEEPFGPPRHTTFVYDYGQGCANLAEADRNFSIITGSNSATTLVSVRPFDTTSAGVYTYSAALTGQPGDLFITNVAPGLNVANGTEGNIREGFFGTVLRNGVVVTGTNSSDLLRYVASEETPIYDIGYDMSLKSQIRGRDAFPKSALSFYRAVVQGKDLGSSYEQVAIKPLPLPDDISSTTIIYQHTSGRPGAGLDRPRNYVISDRDQRWLGHDQQVVPIANPDGDAICAGFNAAQIGLGGQLCQRSAPPASAMIIIDISQSRVTGAEVWAQYWDHDVLIVGPNDADAWRMSGAAPIIKTGIHIEAGNSIESIAAQLWDRRGSLVGTEVDRKEVRLDSQPRALRVDPFGNVKFFMPGIENLDAGTEIDIELDGHCLTGRVLERLFDNPVGTIAATHWGSSGGWEVPGWGPLRVPELIRRCSQPSEFSIAGLVALTPSHGTFQTPRQLSVTVSSAAATSTPATPAAVH